MSTAQDLPGLYGEPLAAHPALRLVPSQPLDFDEAVRRVRPRLHRYAIRRLGDAHEAEELVQEALLRAYTHRDQLHTEEDLSAWSTVVTGRLVIDRLRVRGRSTSVAEVPEGTRVGRDTAEVVVARDEARTALDALDAMPTRQASLLWAREVEGKSYEELCQQFSMTEPAVRSVLTRARKALRREYELRGGTVPVGGLAVLAPWIAGLTWADKLRKCANRITAPAVLGAAGIAALGGLVLSPFGSDGGHNGRTFTPSQAVVASAVQASGANAGRQLDATATHVRPAATFPVITSKPTTTRGTLGHTVLNTVERTQCTEKGDPSLVPSTSVGTPYGIGWGGAHCVNRAADVQLGPDLPLSDTTGLAGLSTSTDVVQCDQPAITTLSQTQLVRCTEETQP